MRELLIDLDRWQQVGEEIALATLVGLRGSAPRPMGARLGLTRSGKMTGSVSGGCVEGDVFERALLVLESGQPVVASYGIADELGFEIGLSCGGTIDVLIEPLAAGDAWRALRCALDEQRPAVLALGLAPEALVGKKLAIVHEQRPAGSIDAELDERVAGEAQALLREGGARVLTLPWRGSEARVFIEAFAPPPRLFIVGATHVAIALCQMAKRVGFHVTVIDARGVFATPERFPDADELLRAWPDDALDGAGLDASSCVALLTHDPKFDLPALASALRSEACYIGAMGSRATHRRRVESLRDQGFDERDLGRIHAPIGLDLGGGTPEELAVAILAEVVAARHGRELRASPSGGA